MGVTFNYSIGGKIYNGDRIFIMGTSAGRAKSSEQLTRWQNPGDITDYPRLQSAYSVSAWTGASTRWLHNASYMRLKNLSFSYSIPTEILKKVKISALRVSFQAENLFTVFGVQGLDPEQSISGVSSYRYPNEKTFSFGVNVSF
ncbi:MAG: hypothetical protein LUD68_04520 [Rikenellaceae bacterium]|nr:hypothetical protein [Rikenellaceae bacterium]